MEILGLLYMLWTLLSAYQLYLVGQMDPGGGDVARSGGRSFLHRF